MASSSAAAASTGAGSGTGAQKSSSKYEPLPGDLTITTARAELLKVSFTTDESRHHIIADVNRPWPLRGVSRVGDALVAVNGKPTTAEKAFPKILHYLNERRNRRAYELTFRLPEVHDGTAGVHSFKTQYTEATGVIEGYLRKLSSGSWLMKPRWQDGRYFVLDPASRVLRRYKRCPTVADKGMKSKDISLDDIVAVTESIPQPAEAVAGRPVRFCLQLRTGQDRLLEANTTEDARVWVAGIATAIRQTVMTTEPTTYIDGPEESSPVVKSKTPVSAATSVAAFSFPHDPKFAPVTASGPASTPLRSPASAPGASPAATAATSAPVPAAAPSPPPAGATARPAPSPSSRAASDAGSGTGLGPSSAKSPVTSPAAGSSAGASTSSPRPGASVVVSPTTSQAEAASGNQSLANPAAAVSSPRSDGPLPRSASGRSAASGAPPPHGVRPVSSSPPQVVDLATRDGSLKPALQDSQRLVQEIINRQKANATDEFDIVYERLQVLMLPPREYVSSSAGRAEQPRLGLSLSDTPDGRIFVAAVLPNHENRGRPISRARSRGRSTDRPRTSRSRSRGARPERSSSRGSGSRRSSSPASVGATSVYSCTSYDELRQMTRQMKASIAARSPRSNVTRHSLSPTEDNHSEEGGQEQDLLVFDETTLPLVNAEGLDPDTLEPVTASSEGTGLRPGDVIMALDNLPVKRTDTLASVAQRLLRRTMSRGTWVTVARPIGRIPRPKAHRRAARDQYAAEDETGMGDYHRSSDGYDYDPRADANPGMLGPRDAHEPAGLPPATIAAPAGGRGGGVPVGAMEDSNSPTSRDVAPPVRIRHIRESKTKEDDDKTSPRQFSVRQHDAETREKERVSLGHEAPAWIQKPRRTSFVYDNTGLGYGGDVSLSDAERGLEQRTDALLADPEIASAAAAAAAAVASSPSASAAV